jgi:RHS repeat-associated protein
VAFNYTFLSRRIQKVFTQNSTTTTTNYLYDGDNAIETVDQNGNLLTKFAQGQNIDEPLAESVGGAIYDYEQDGLGSATSLTNSSGALALSYTYDSFGKISNSQGSVSNPFRYTGRDFDSETGLYYYRARYYDPITGRFASEDPVGFRGGGDFYKYVANNPTNLADPMGFKPSKWKDYYDCLQICLHDTLSCNFNEFKKNLKQTAAGGPIVGVGVCGMVSTFEPYLAPAFLPCAGVVTVSTWSVGGAASAGFWNIRNLSSTVGCTTFCALNTR